MRRAAATQQRKLMTFIVSLSGRQQLTNINAFNNKRFLNNLRPLTNNNNDQFDVVVVGGGHAGTEAAAAANRRGSRVALITPQPVKSIGEMSCNPSIGGLGKGTLVREIDALDGLMAKTADDSGIQFRVLNSSKGKAVRGVRAQMDRELYKKHMQKLVGELPNVTVVDACVSGLLIEEEEEEERKESSNSSRRKNIDISNSDSNNRKNNSSSSNNNNNATALPGLTESAFYSVFSSGNAELVPTVSIHEDDD